jgi:hypothetical protein
MASCRVPISPSDPQAVGNAAQTVKILHEKRKAQLARTQKIIEGMINKLTPAQITTIQIARAANRQLTPAELKQLIPSAYDALTEEQVENRIAEIASAEPRYNTFDREIARGQLVAGLPVALVKFHKAILAVETGFNAQKVRCRATDEATGRLGCAGSMMGMGQLALVYHVDNASTNPNRYGVEQLEDVPELNVEVSARVVRAGFARGEGLAETAKYYKLPARDTYQRKFDRTTYSNRVREWYNNLYGEYPYPAQPLPEPEP